MNFMLYKFYVNFLKENRMLKYENAFWTFQDEVFQNKCPTNNNTWASFN